MDEIRTSLGMCPQHNILYNQWVLGIRPAITPQPTLFIRGSHAFNLANMSGNIYFSL
jgi:hypothetical protein